MKEPYDPGYLMACHNPLGRPERPRSGRVYSRSRFLLPQEDERGSPFTQILPANISQK